MPEKRKFKRRHLIYYLRVFEKNGDTPLGYVVDISPGGTMIMSESPIETEKVFQLKKELQTKLNEKEYLNFDARSIWCKNDINPDFYDTGFQLLNVTQEDFRSIEDIIDELGFRD